MNCQEARKLIDLRVHGMSLDAPESSSGKGAAVALGDDDVHARTPISSGWSELDAHLDACPRCRAELDELGGVRRLLAEAADVRPHDAESESMWTGLETAVAVSAAPIVAGSKGWWARNRSVAVSLVGVAAVLVIAFQLGNLRYGGFSLSRARSIGPFSNIDRSLPTASPEGPARTERGRHALEALGYIGGISKKSPSPSPSPPAAPEFSSLDNRNLSGNKEVAVARTERASQPSPASANEEEFADNALSAPGYVGGKNLRLQHAPLPSSTYPDTKKPVDEPQNAALVELNRYEPPATEARKSAQSTGTGSVEPQRLVPQNLKIIKTGELTVEVAAYSDAVSRVERVVAEKGGFLADAATQEEAGGALIGRIVVRVSPERFEELFAALKAVGRVESENVKAADVTAEYVDTEARIKSLQITEERLRELIANKSFVDKIASLLEVERELNRVRSQIEQLQGQLRVMADRVALSTIAVTLREPARTVPSASLSVEVSTLDDASQALGSLLAETGGRLLSGKTAKRNDGTLMGTYQLETTLARFAKVVTGIEALGRIEERQVKDQQFDEAGQSWAARVNCSIALVLFERSRQLPSGSLRLEVDRLEDTVKSLGEILQTHDSSMVSNQAMRLSDGSSAAEIRLRVPAGRFADLLDAIALLGRITAKVVSGDAGQIVGGAAVVPCDLSLTLAEKPREVPRGTMSVEVSGFEGARQALSRAIAEKNVQVLSSSSNQRNDGTWQGTFRLGVPAAAMEDFVGRLEGFGRVTTRQIHGLGLGDLSRIDPDSLGMIELTLAEKSTLAPAPDESAASIRARVRDGLAGFYTSIGMIAYGLVVLLPWLILAGLVGWIVVRIRGLLRRRQAAHAPSA